MTHFDLIVIGSGPAGEKGAAQAAYFGKRVALVERRDILGGARIHNCALPSKALRETASRRGDPGDAPLSELLCRREPLVSSEVARVTDNLRRHGVTVLYGHARFTGAHSVDVGGRAYTADVFLIATGSKPVRPSEIPFDHPRVDDTDTFLRVQQIPRSLVVAGGGVIGCELASMLARLGVEVTLIDRSDRLLRFADADVSRTLADSFRADGIRLRLGEHVSGVRPDDDGVTVELGASTALRADRALFCVGRAGNTASLGVDAAGVLLGDRGLVPVDDRYRTAVPHIYAAGDVVGFPGLASTSMEQARLAMCDAFDLRYKTRVSPILPLGIYTIPEFSMVGETEQSARRAGIDCEVGRAWYRDNPRGQLLGDAAGLLKLVFCRETRRLLGAHIVGERAADLIHIASANMQHGAAIDAFIDAVYNYPTLSELYKYAAYDGLGRL
jgi:NAD(P) transhydrogenase